MSADRFQLSEMRFIKRIVVGSENPNAMKTEAEIQAAAELLNRCLAGTPRGYIMGVEKNFSVLSVGEHQVVLQHMVYHVGFARKPTWLE